VTFAPSERSKTVTVTIEDDKNIENIETFCAKLTTTDPKVSAVGPPKAVISIVDDDGKRLETTFATFAFASQKYMRVFKV
jgi:hypothetical protein